MEKLLPLDRDTDAVLQAAWMKKVVPPDLTLPRSHSVMDGPDYVKTQIRRLTIEACLPRMKVSKRDTRSGTSAATFTSAKQDNKHTGTPCFTYEHGDVNGVTRNLPGHAQLIRILMEISKSSRTSTDSVNVDNNDVSPDNKWLSLYTVCPPRPADRPRRRRFMRVSVCTFCRTKGGKHKKWCVNFVHVQPENPYSSMRRSKTDISELFARPTREATPVLVEREQKPSKRFSLRPSDFPDYTNLHRAVYEDALAASRAKLTNRLTKHNMFTLDRQITDPYIFSYMNEYGTRHQNSVKDGMAHIFGSKNVNFATRYEHAVKSIKDQQNEKK